MDLWVIKMKTDSCNCDDKSCETGIIDYCDLSTYSERQCCELFLFATMSSPTKATSNFSVLELKEKLRALGLSAAGVKAELIHQLMEADPSGNCAKGSKTEPANREEDII